MSLFKLVSEILQKTVRSVYHISMGLLLRDDLHRALDRYDWGLHCKVRRIHIQSAATVAGSFFHYSPTAILAGRWQIHRSLLRIRLTGLDKFPWQSHRPSANARRDY